MPRFSSATASFAIFLDRRAGYCAVRAKDAAVSRFGSKNGVALLALVKPLAGVGGHGFGLDVLTLWASQRGFQNDDTHFETPAKLDG